MTEPQSLVEVVSRFLPLKQNGAECHARCPFHPNDDAESFRVKATAWRCLACSEQEVTSGDAAGFLMSWTGCDRAQAEQELAEGALPEPMAIQQAEVRRVFFWTVKALIDNPAPLVWIHWQAESVHFGREHMAEGRVHIGLCPGRPIDDDSIKRLKGRSCILIPDNRESSFERMDELAQKLYAAGHVKVRYVRVQDQEDCYAWPSGLTPEQALTFVQEHVSTYPNNGAAPPEQANRVSMGGAVGAEAVHEGQPDSLVISPKNPSPATAAPPNNALPSGPHTHAVSASGLEGGAPSDPGAAMLAAPHHAAPTPAPAVASGHHPLVAPPIDTAGVGDAPTKPPKDAPGSSKRRSKPPAEPATPAIDAALASVFTDNLLRSPKGEIKACDHNAKELIAAAKQYDELYFDDFLCRMRVGERDWSDHDDRDTLCWLQSKHQVPGFTLGQARTAVLALAYARRRDSLLEFVMGVPEWDGTPRIETAFIDAWGAVDTALARAASRNLFIAMHARAVKPGAQVDNLWVIEGPQGALKSASLRSLGGSLHAEISASVGTADFLRELRGIWIAEMSELDSLRGREASTIKRLLSAPSDRFVDKYDRHAVAYPRRAVVVATTNEANYWQDATGARRLIPIRAGKIDIAMIESQRLQWFAEARHEYQAGRSWWEFPSGTDIAQEDRQVIDPWEDILRAAITHGSTDNYGSVSWPDGWISSATIMRDWLKLDASQQGQSSSTRLGKVMRHLGFVPHKFGKERERGWIKDTQEVS